MPYGGWVPQNGWVRTPPLVSREKTAFREETCGFKARAGLSRGGLRPSPATPGEGELEPGSRRPQKTQESSLLGWTATQDSQSADLGRRFVESNRAPFSFQL
jgi:hypothetical protein